jgi:SAM-dependent methyltransferase
LAQTPGRPDYGLDAPGGVRNLLLVGAAGFALVILSRLGVLPAVPRLQVGGVRIGFPLRPGGLWIGIGFTLTGFWMIWSSKVGKVREREALLDRIAWRGDEQVLDVGCGRGLLLVGAARRLATATGKATGIDLWQAEDLSGNRPDAALANARAEGVADRVAVETGDMRKLPFPDGTFDVAVSRAAIHNLYDRADREQAIREIARVLKPGGQALIDDIRHHGEYARTFAASGCPDVRRVGSPVAAVFWTLLTMGSLRPDTLHARKAT